VLVWLERNVKEVLRLVDSNDPRPNQYAERLVKCSAVNKAVMQV